MSAVLFFDSARKNACPVVILIGQSNAVGLGAISGAPSQYQGTIAGTKIWNGSAFVNLVAGSTNQGNDALSFGPELSLCTQFKARVGANTVYLIKHAVSSTSLNVDWLPTSGTQYTNAISKINAALAALSGVNYYIAGFVWVQGENDAASASITPSNNYQTNLTSLISNLRSTYGTHGLNGNANIPFVVAQLGFVDRYYYYYQDNVRNAQALVRAAGTNVYVAQTDDLGFNADVIHYNATSQVTLGIRAANHLAGEATYVENVPPSYSSITYWFDSATPNTCLTAANVIVTAGNPIYAVWGRQSLALNVANATGGNQPTVTASAINGKQAATFDGTNDQLTASSVNPSLLMGSTSGTVFLIQKYAVDKAATSFYISAGTNSNINTANKWKTGGLDNIYWDFANTSTGRLTGTAPAGITGNWKVSEFVKRAAGTSEVYVGGISAVSGSASGTMASATGTLRVGCDGTNFFNGQIAEIICYNKELSSDERTAAYAYINAKYGL